MNKLKFYKNGCIALLLLNFAVLTILFLGRPGPGSNGKPDRNRAREMMKLDDRQNDLFQKEAEKHIGKMKNFNGEQRELLRGYFSSLLSGEESVDTESILQKVQLLERNKIESTYQHFLDIKALLNPEQEADFMDFTREALEKILLQQKK